MEHETQVAGWSAVVLAGGRGARLGGADKATVEVDGRPLLDHALDALAAAREVVVVGDPVPGLTGAAWSRGQSVTFTREEPRYGGPAAGLLTGVDTLQRRTAWVAVLAVDMPRVTPATYRRLLGAATGHDGAVLRGPDGRRQLALVLDRARLEEVRPDRDAQHDLAVWRLLAPLDLVEVDGVGAEHRDLDTWADLHDLPDVPGRRDLHAEE